MSVASSTIAIKIVFVLFLVSKREMFKLVNPFLVRILIFKFIRSIPRKRAKNLIGPNDLYTNL